MPRIEFGYSDSSFAGQDEYGALTWIKNGYGGEVTFGSDHRTGSAAAPHVLATLTLRSGAPGATDAVWRYQGYDWDASGEADKLAGGFKRMDVTRPDGTLERYEFETILDVGGKFDHLAGRVKKMQVCNDAACATGHILSRIDTTWLHQLPANYPHLSNYGAMAPKDQPKFVYKEVETSFKDEQPQSKMILKYQDFRQLDEAGVGKQYGNLTEQQEIEWDANAGAWKSAPYRTTYTVFYPATGVWVIDKAALQEVFRKTWDDPLGQRLLQTFLFYDQTGNYQTRPTQGLLRRVQTGLGSLWQDSYYEYWSGSGSLYKTTDALGRSTRTFYDPTFGAYVLCIENALGWEVQHRYYGIDGGNQVGADGASCNPASGSGIDAANGRVFGLLEEEKDANGAVTTYTYDLWERLLAVWRPGENKTAGHAATETVVYPAFIGGANGGYTAPFVVRTGRRDDAGGASSAAYLESWLAYDGLGQLIQTQAEAETSGQRNIVDFWYDGQGRRQRQSIAYAAAITGDVYASPQAQPHTDYAYDALGRTTTITNTDLTVTRSFYSAAAGGDRTAMIDANQRQVIQETDGFGRLARVRQYEGNFGAGPNWGATVYAEAVYTYDEFDRLAGVTGPGNAATSLGYDALGRKTSLDDPDMGAWSYGYDTAGNLTRQTDARNQRTCFYYDALNRLKGKTYSSGASACPSDPGSYTVSYYYDETTGGNKGLGRRTGFVVYSGSAVSNTAAWVYDERGRVTSETRKLDGAGYTTNTTYDAADRVKTRQYADGEIVTYVYNPQGLLDGLSRTSPDSYDYVGDTSYNALGQVELRKLGSLAGVLTTDYVYRTDNNRLQWLKTGLNSPNYDDLQNLEYAYDAVGNVDWVKDYKAPGSVQTLDFSYDALNRLTNGVTSGGSSGTYNETYGYAYNAGGKAGNLTSKTGLGNYIYGAQAADCPEGALSKSHAVVMAGSYTYCYDQNGNMRRRTIGSNIYTLTYDAENRLIGVSGAATAVFVYDADGGRVKSTFGSGDGANPSRYLGSLLETSKSYWEDFQDLNAQGWTATAGSWSAASTAYKQSATSGIARTHYAVTQGKGMELRWKMTFHSTTKAGGVYLLASSSSGAEYGNSYRIWQDGSQVRLFKALANGAPQQMAVGSASVTTGQTYSYVLRYNLVGRFVLWRDGVQVLNWTDSSGLTSGSYLALRTDSSVVSFDDIEVARFKKYYDAGGQRVAMREAETVSFLLSDHLGSTAVTANTSGARTGELWYKPWGEYRGTAYGTTPTSYRFTGQREDATIGLYFYNARYYDPVLGRFIQADTIVPEPGNPQALNRYSYAGNRPTVAVDPTGHCPQPTGQYANANVICVAGFIATQTSTGLPYLVYFQGDNRDFSSASDREDSRFWLWISVDTGEILEKGVHPTQRVSGPKGEPIGESSPPRNESNPNTFLEKLLGSNQFSATKSDNGAITLSYHVVCSDPICNNLLAPDGSITFTPNGRGSYDAFGKVNEFPNLEAYHWKGGALQTDYVFRLQNFSEKELASGHANASTSWGMATYMQFDTRAAPRLEQASLFYALSIR